jgi:hypothetical protein
VTLFEGRNTPVLEEKKTTSSNGVSQTRTADIVDDVYVNI